MNEAINDIPALAKPFIDVAGKVTKLVRHDFRLRRLAAPTKGAAK
jgi:hypothetical protein